LQEIPECETEIKEIKEIKKTKFYLYSLKIILEKTVEKIIEIIKNIKDNYFTLITYIINLNIQNAGDIEKLNNEKNEVENLIDREEFNYDQITEFLKSKIDAEMDVINNGKKIQEGINNCNCNKIIKLIFSDNFKNGLSSVFKLENKARFYSPFFKSRLTENTSPGDSTFFILTLLASLSNENDEKTNITTIPNLPIFTSYDEPGAIPKVVKDLTLEQYCKNITNRDDLKNFLLKMIHAVDFVGNTQQMKPGNAVNINDKYIHRINFKNGEFVFDPDLDLSSIPTKKPAKEGNVKDKVKKINMGVTNKGGGDVGGNTPQKSLSELFAKPNVSKSTTSITSTPTSTTTLFKFGELSSLIYLIEPCFEELGIFTGLISQDQIINAIDLTNILKP
jgi:hypothetical protein